MFRLFTITLVCLISFAIGACRSHPRSPKVYKPYTGFQLSKDTYQIESSGGIFGSKGKVNRLLLKRAALVTKQNGYRYFTILSSNQDVEEAYITTPTTINSSSNTSYSGGTYNTTGTSTINPSATIPIRSYTNTAIIKMFNNPKQYQFAFDADLILKNK